MDVARLHRNVNHILLDLQRAVDTYAVAEAADLYGLAWSQVAEAPPSETRKQREELQAFKKVINSASWLEEGRQARRRPKSGTSPRPGSAPRRVRGTALPRSARTVTCRVVG